MASWTEGDNVGRYTLKRRLGTGSFAEVWLANDVGELGFTRKVAVKLLRNDAADPASVAAFLREARLAANLHHPNTVDIVRVEMVGELVVVAMDYVDWGSLKDLIDKVAMAGLSIPRSVVLDVAIDIVRGLHHGHTATGPEDQPLCIVHRDVKPANVLIESSGTARLADFGLAKAVGEATATTTGMLKGTPAYVAPEIWKGGRDFHPTVDLFAAGCILHELVTLERLFQGDSMPSIFGQVALRTAAEDARAAHREFPVLGPIVERLLVRDPQHRYRDGADVIEDLLEIRRSVIADSEVSVFLKLIDAAGAGAAAGGVRVPGSVTDPSWAAAFASATGETVPVQESVPTPVSAAPTGTQSLVVPSPDERMAGRTQPARFIAMCIVAALLVGAIALVVSGRDPGADLHTPLPFTEPLAAGDETLVIDEPESPAVAVPDLGALASPEATPSPTRPRVDEARSIVKREVAPSLIAEPAPVATPAVERTSVPAAVAVQPQAPDAPAKSCLAFTSQPPGARLWIGGVLQSGRALAGAGRVARYEPGTHTVGMGMGDEASATVLVNLAAGQTLRVNCELLVGRACTTALVRGGACE